MFVISPPIWLLLAPVYLLIVVAIAVTWAIISARARKRSKDPPSCRRCGYAVVGLDRGVCPECGSHLTDALAIVHPDTVGVRTATKRLTVFTLLASYPALVAGVVLAELSIWPNLCGASVHAYFSQPASRAYDIAQMHVVNFMADHGFNGDPTALADEARCLLSALNTLVIASNHAASGRPQPSQPTQPAPFAQASYGTTVNYCENPWWVAWVIGAVISFFWITIAAFILVGARRQALRNRLALQQAIASTNKQGHPS